MSTSCGDVEADAVFDAVEYCGGIGCGRCLDSGLDVRCSEVNAWNVDRLLPD